MLTMRQRIAVTDAVRKRYRKSTKKKKSEILSEFVATTGYNRSYARLVLGSFKKQGRKPKYPPRKRVYDILVFYPLRKLWLTADCICGQRLKPFIPELISVLEKKGEMKLEKEVKKKLRRIGSATIDRLLKATRKQYELRGRTTTKPGTLLKHQIPIRTFSDWDENKPGFLETDTVSFGGGSASGHFVWGLDMTDVFTGWTLLAAVMGRGQERIHQEVKDGRDRLPFPLLGLDSDSGGEFINDILFRYCKDEKITFSFPGSAPYTPVNYDGRYHGKVTLRQALANSYNIPAVKTAKNLGPDSVVDLGNRMGLKDWEVDGSYGLSVTLGGKETSLMNLTNVFATLSREGVYKEVTPFESILDVNGFEIYSPTNIEGERAISKEVSYIITNILSDYYARIPAFGTNNFLSILGHSVAVKTGTTDSKRDNYTVGYTPSFVVGVWVGNNDNSPMNPNLASGLSGAAPIWNQTMSSVLDKRDVEKFEMPSDIVIKTDKECGNITEFFVKGTVPARLCAEKKDESNKNKKDKNKD